MKLSVLQWNIRSFPRNKIYLQKAVDDINPQIICLQETWAKPKTPLQLPGFSVSARLDRPVAVGGGVSIHVQSHIPTSPVPLPAGLEATAVKVHLPSHNLTICSVYIPPDFLADQIKTSLTALSNSLPTPFLICGDYNGHHQSWGSPYTDARGREIDDWMETSQLALLNTGEPTRLGPQGTYSHIDLSIASCSIAPSLSWSVHHDPYHSDHFPLVIKSGLPVHPLTKPQRWNLTKANWTSFQSSLDLPTTFLSPSEACSVMEGRIKTAATSAVPRSTGHSKRKQTHHWWTTTCTTIYREKQKALHNYQRHKGDIDIWIVYKKTKAIFIHTTRTARKDSWMEFVCTISLQTCSSEVWRALRRLRCSPPPAAIVIRDGDNTVSDTGPVAELLAKDFSSRGVSGTPTFMAHRFLAEQTPLHFHHSSAPSYNTDLTMPELNRALSSVRNTSPGPDDIPYDFIKHFTTEQLESLLKYYNFLWNNGLPHQWKHSIVLPIPKPSKPSYLSSSYRPIALTNCMCKLMERVVNARLQLYLNSQCLLDPHQSGFRMGHSTQDAVYATGVGNSHQIYTG